MAQRVPVPEPSKASSPVVASPTAARPEPKKPSPQKATIEESPEKPKERKRVLFGKKKEPDSSQDKPPTPILSRRPRFNKRQMTQVKQSRIYYSTDEEVRDALMEFGVFLIFLVLTSIVALSVRGPYMYYLNNTIKELFSVREMVVQPTVTISFEKILTVSDWWDYLENNFLVTLHGGTTITLDDGTSVDTSNSTSEIDDDETETNSTAEEDSSPEEESQRFRLTEDRLYMEDGYVEIDDDTGDNSFRNERTEREFREIEEKDNPAREKVDKRQAGGAGVAGDGSNALGILANDSKHSINYLRGRVFLRENLMLGPPRIRQIRVRKGSCYVNDAFIRYFNTCYAPYSKSAEDTSKTHRGTSFMSMSDLGSTPIWTLLTLYRSGGYVVDLSYEKDANNKKIKELKDLNWVDRGARLCVIEFSIYNENTDIFQSVKLIAEIPPTGCIIPQTHLCTVREYSFFTERSLFLMVCYIFWYVMIVYYTIFETNELRKTGFKIYYRSLLNVLDGIVLLFCYLAFVYNIWHTFYIKSITSIQKIDHGFLCIDYLCFWNNLYVDMMALLAFLVWIKIFKFISFNKTLVQFTTTLRRCYKDLAGFSLMFGIVFLAYAQLGLLLFGTKHPDFDTFTTSILTMVRMILGDFQYKLIEQANRVLGPIYFLTYILLMFFILLNMFLAIIMETYNSVKSEITTGRSHLGSYIYRKIGIAFNWIFYFCLRRRRQRQSDGAGLAVAATEDPRRTRFQRPQNFEDTNPDIEEKELYRLKNRVMRLEDILEQLVNNLDIIKNHIDKGHFKTKKRKPAMSGL
ncbi:polycystic kidney disease 2-like 1 protein [Drosophila persimilis]|nr:polycystic kidney disease 2-like 1 protein [Drosophila persimilis]